MKIKIQKTFQYSTEEKWTGKYWVDGKKIYSKVITNITLPNTTEITIPAGITNVDKMVNVYGFATNGNVSILLPLVGTTMAANISLYYVNGTNNIGLATGTNRTSFIGNIVLEYTKTTD